MRFALSKPRRRRSWRGLSLIEVMLAIALGGVMMIAGTYTWNQKIQDVRDKSAADQMRTFSEAAGNYIHDYIGQLEAKCGLTPAVCSISKQDMINAGYLPASWTTVATSPGSGLGAYGDDYEVLLRIVPYTTPNGTAYGAQAYAIAGDGKRPIPDTRLPFIAAMCGGTCGYVHYPNSYDKTAAAFRGAYGAYNEPLTDFGSPTSTYDAPTIATPRLVAQINTDDLINSDYLYRNTVAGHPEVNTMDTDINMNGNNLDNTAGVYGQSGTLTLQDNKGTPTTTVTIGGVGGDFNVVGNSQFTGGVTVGSSTVSQTLTVFGAATTTGSSTVNGTSTLNGETTINGQTNANGYIMANSGVVLPEIASAGAACSQEGLISLSNDGQGMVLSCIGRVWAASSSGQVGAPSMATGAFQCRAGYTMVTYNTDVGRNANGDTYPSTWEECIANSLAND